MEKKKKTKNKKRFTWVNLAQLLTVAALLLWMQWAVDSGRVLTIFVASPTSIVEEGIKIITDGTLWPHLLLTIQEALAGYLSAVVVGIAVGLIWTLFPVSEKYMNVFCSAIMAVPKVAILPVDPVVRHRLPVQGISGISVLGIYDPVQYRDRSQGV